jgi:hypothetical protein
MEFIERRIQGDPKKGIKKLSKKRIQSDPKME